MIVSFWKKYLLAAFCILFSPIIYFLIWLRTRNPAATGEPRHWRETHKTGIPVRILIIPHLATIGDLVCATPVFSAIKKQYPDSFLAVVVTKMTAGIIKNNPHVNEILIYRADNLAGLMSRIRKLRFGWSFSLTGSLFGALVSFSGLIPNRASTIYDGMSLGARLAKRFNNRQIFYKHHTYLPGHYLKMLELIGIKNPEDKKEVFVSPEADKRADDFLKTRGLLPPDPLIGISITAGNKIKEWGDEKFRELAVKIADKYGAKIIFRGSKADEERIDKVLTGLDPQRFIKEVDFSLEDMPAIIKRMRLYIAVDSGPIYVAHALGVPVIDIIGPVDPAEQPPEDEKSIQVRPPSTIKPSSFVFKNPGSPEDHQKAVNSITVDMVMSAVDNLLN